jgi:hypothetical protein
VACIIVSSITGNRSDAEKKPFLRFRFVLSIVFSSFPTLSPGKFLLVFDDGQRYKGRKISYAHGIMSTTDTYLKGSRLSVLEVFYGPSISKALQRI